MEPRKIFKSKFFAYKQAVEGFIHSLQIDISSFDEIVADSIKNGQIQKFEYCTELTWKIVKRFLYLFAGLDTNSPKEAIKYLFTTKYVNQKDYEALMAMIEDRNMLSHIYRQEYFNKIYVKLKEYSERMEKIIAVIESEEQKQQ